MNKHLMSTALLAAALCAAANARVTRIVIDERVAERPPAGAGQPAYERMAGRAFGELDPKLAGNAIIQDIELATDADGKVRYVASFVIVKPVDAARASGLMWHDVPNRGRVFAFAPQEHAFGDILLASAWQGDNAGATAVRPTASVAGMRGREGQRRVAIDAGARAPPSRQPQPPGFPATTAGRGLAYAAAP